MRRREVVAGIAALGAGRSAAQGTATLRRIGLLTPAAPIGDGGEMGAGFLRGMAQHGYVRGRDFSLDSRGAMGRVGELPRIVRDLLGAGVEVMVTTGFPPALAAKGTGLPTVAAAGAGDPVATGLVDSLPHPGGNLTGISDDAAELTVKRLGFLKEIAPDIRRISVLWNEDDLGMTLRTRASTAAAEQLGIAVDSVGVREPDDFKGAFAVMERQRPDAILMVADALTILNRKRVFEFALAQRIPAIYEASVFVRDGGLMSYGADVGASFERAAAFVDRILRGASPADLPFESPTRYVFALNIKTSQAIGLTISPSLLTRADEVIE